MKPVLEELARKHAGRVVVEVVDLRDPAGEKRAEAHRVNLIPTQILLDADGKERFRHEGSMTGGALETEMRKLGWIR